jgi:hypothetical protein
MTARALLVVIAASEPVDRPAPAGLIALTCSDVRACSPSLSSSPAASGPAHTPGHTGDDATSTAPGPAITSANKQPIDGHNDLRLEY